MNTAMSELVTRMLSNQQTNIQTEKHGHDLKSYKITV